jgi:hypothetical protein
LANVIKLNRPLEIALSDIHTVHPVAATIFRTLAPNKPTTARFSVLPQFASANVFSSLQTLAALHSSGASTLAAPNKSTIARFSVLPQFTSATVFSSLQTLAALHSSGASTLAAPNKPTTARFSVLPQFASATVFSSLQTTSPHCTHPALQRWLRRTNRQQRASACFLGSFID